MSSLSLTRRESQTLTIGDDVRITVANIRNRKVVLHVEAPGRVQIMRAECVDDPSSDKPLVWRLIRRALLRFRRKQA